MPTTRRDPAHLPPLDLLAGFEAAARRLSFTLAADERFVTQSAISRQVKALEDELGTALFVRGHRSLQLTADGAQLHATCSTVLAQLRSTVAHIRQRQRREVLSLTTTPGLASLWLIPRLPLFAQAHPGIDVRIDATLDARDLSRDGFDLAIRYQALAGKAAPLFGESLLPVCSPRLLRQGPALTRAADLAGHTLIDLSSTHGGPGMPTEWQNWLRTAGQAHLEPVRWLSFNSYAEAISAALDGQGVTLGRRPLVNALLKSRRLVAPFGGEHASERGYVLVLADGAAQRPAVLALAAWLRDQARGQARDQQMAGATRSRAVKR